MQWYNDEPSDQMQWYSDEPEVYATVSVGNREIKIRDSPESNAFFASACELDDPEEVLGLSIWLTQMCSLVVDSPERVIANRGMSITIEGRTHAPFATAAGLRMMRSISQTSDRDQRYAVAQFLSYVSYALMHRAANMDPNLIDAP